MALRKIVKSQDPLLREKAKPVRKMDGTLEKLLDEMGETMRHAQGIGLAAPQVGISKQIVVADGGEEGILELANPRVVHREGEAIAVEGCLSIPGVYGEVPRPYKVVVEALNRKGEKIRREAEGMLARVLQHEIDHLHGILFTDRATRLLDPEEIEAEG